MLVGCHAERQVQVLNLKDPGGCQDMCAKHIGAVTRPGRSAAAPLRLATAAGCGYYYGIPWGKVECRVLTHTCAGEMQGTQIEQLEITLANLKAGRLEPRSYMKNLKGV